MDYRYSSSAASQERSRNTAKSAAAASGYPRRRGDAEPYSSGRRPSSQSRQQAGYPQERQTAAEYSQRRRATSEYSQRQRATAEYPQGRRSASEYPQRQRTTAEYPQTRRSASEYPQRQRTATEYPQTRRAPSNDPGRRRQAAASASGRRTTSRPSEASGHTRQDDRHSRPRSAAARQARIRQKKKRLLAALIFKGVLFLLACILFVAIFLKARSGKDPDSKTPHGIVPQDFLAQQASDAQADQSEPQTAPQATDAQPSSSDTEAPVVSADDIYVTAGGVVSYKKAIQAYDNVDSADQLTLDVNNSQVDLNTVGDYPYTVTVTDRGGNSAQANAVVHVLEAGTPTADIDEVNALADQILAKIINDNMLPKEKLRAIYDWIQSETHYEGHSQEDDVALAAYVGFTEHTGNCFTYMAQAKFLLTRAGIENLVVTKVVPEGNTDIPTHYWNLVNVGEGWYHYDPTPRKDRRDFFYLTDAELMEYSNSREGYGTHVYDPSLYPEIQ